MEQQGGYINNTLIELLESNPKLDELRESITELRKGDKENYRVCNRKIVIYIQKEYKCIFSV